MDDIDCPPSGNFLGFHRFVSGRLTCVLQCIPRDYVCYLFPREIGNFPFIHFHVFMRGCVDTRGRSFHFILALKFLMELHLELWAMFVGIDGIR